MINEKVLANSVATVSAAVFVICRLLASIAPNTLYKVGSSWFHTIQLESAYMIQPMTMNTFIFGLVTLAVFSWVVTYATAALYNRSVK